MHCRLRAHPEEVVTRCEGNWRHQLWAVGRTFAQCRYCAVKACPVFSWRYLGASLLALPATAPVGLWLSGMRYFVLDGRPLANCRASAHFFSEISRLRFASDLGSGTLRGS